VRRLIKISADVSALVRCTGQIPLPWTCSLGRHTLLVCSLEKTGLSWRSTSLRKRMAAVLVALALVPGLSVGISEVAAARGGGFGGGHMGGGFGGSHMGGGFGGGHIG